MQAYIKRVRKMERKVLLESPRAPYTKRLHMIGGDLVTLKRSILPTQHVIETLMHKPADSKITGRHAYITYAVLLLSH